MDLLDLAPINNLTFHVISSGCSFNHRLHLLHLLCQTNDSLSSLSQTLVPLRYPPEEAMTRLGSDFFLRYSGVK